jgi:hypothetical protein
MTEMRQLILASASFERYGRLARRAAFLAEMERVVPWRDLCRLIEPVYPKPGNGRPPIGLERMLRIQFLQHWFPDKQTKFAAVMQIDYVRAFATVTVPLGTSAREPIGRTPANETYAYGVS